MPGCKVKHVVLATEKIMFGWYSRNQFTLLAKLAKSIVILNEEKRMCMYVCAYYLYIYITRYEQAWHLEHGITCRNVQQGLLQYVTFLRITPERVSNLLFSITCVAWLSVASTLRTAPLGLFPPRGNLRSNSLAAGSNELSLSEPHAARIGGA